MRQVAARRCSNVGIGIYNRRTLTRRKARPWTLKRRVSRLPRQLVALRNRWTTPQGLADPQAAVPALVSAAQQLQQRFDAIECALGRGASRVLVTHDANFSNDDTFGHEAFSGSDIIFGGIRIVWPFPAPERRAPVLLRRRKLCADCRIHASRAEAQTLLTYGNALVRGARTSRIS